MQAASHVLAATAAMLLLRAASAAPAPEPTKVAARVAAPASPTDPWVSVDASGHPHTITPVMTTISGTPTMLSAAPNDITGSVFTQTRYGEVTTRTGDAPAPTATGGDGAGSFPVCKKEAGAKDPFCAPDAGATLNPGTTYYILWDPSFFPTPNTTLTVQGNYFNSTTGAVLSEAFSSGKLAAAWSFYAWKVDKSVMTDGRATNITLQIAAVSPGSTAPNMTRGPMITVADKPGYQSPPTQAPTGPALYVGLPTILGFVAVVLVGTCLWNRHARKIGLGNIMGRGRNGYGVSKSRAQRMAGGVGRRQRRENKDAIRLVQREVPSEEQYHDAPGQHGQQQQHDEFVLDRPRRDSDCLGSLAGTPTEDRHMDFPRPGGRGNAFRDEVDRQNRDRQGY